jgi:hypothetical protein
MSGSDEDELGRTVLPIRYSRCFVVFTMWLRRNVNNIWGVYFENDLHWTWDEINNFIGALGVSLIVSGMTVKQMIAYFGLRMFTTFCNCCNIASWVMFSGIGPLSYFSGTARMWLG